MSSNDMMIKEQNISEEELSHSGAQKTYNEKQKGISKARKVVRENSQKYHWKQQENIKYLEFIISCRKLFDLTLEEKKYMGINKLMSHYVKTRDSVQCHSHHQKIIKKYGNIDQAIVDMTKMYIHKSSFLRKRNCKNVKFQENCLRVLKEGGIHQQSSSKKGFLEDSLAAIRQTSGQVKIQYF